MRFRASFAFSAPMIAAGLAAIGFLALAYAHGPEDHAGVSVTTQSSTPPRLKQPPVKLDPELERWTAMVMQNIDREIKAELAAAEELRRSRQLKDEALYRPTVAPTARELAAQTSPAQPMVLTRTEPASGEPGDFIRFFFNQTPPRMGPDAKYEVHFVVANGRDMATEGWTTDLPDGRRAVVGRVPQVFGIPSYNGRAYVNYNGKYAGGQPFAFKPKIDEMVMSMTRIEWLDDMSFGGTQGGWVDADLFRGIICHESLPLLGDKGDDEFWRTRKLKNGWVTVRASVVGHPSVNNIPYGCSVTSSRPGTDSPYVRVHWWFDRGAAPFVYHCFVTIKGPAGLSYK